MLVPTNIMGLLPNWSLRRQLQPKRTELQAKLFPTYMYVGKGIDLICPSAHMGILKFRKYGKREPGFTNATERWETRGATESNARDGITSNLQGVCSGGRRQRGKMLARIGRALPCPSHLDYRTEAVVAGPEAVCLSGKCTHGRAVV